MGNKSESIKTEVAEGGLRYTAKKAGSIFGASGGKTFGGSSMSCFSCGTHKAMSAMVSKKIIGKSRKVCGDGCKKP